MNATTVNPERLVTRVEAAQLLAVSPATLDRMAASGKIPAAMKLSRGCCRYRATDLAKWLEWGCPTREEFERRKNADSAKR